MTRITAGIIGKCAVVDRSDDLAYYVSLALLRPNSSVLDSRYLKYYLESGWGRKELSKWILWDATPTKINKDAIGKILVAIPLLKTQKRLVQVIENFDFICSDLNIGLPAAIEARKKYEYYRYTAYILDSIADYRYQFAERIRRCCFMIYLYTIPKDSKEWIMKNDLFFNLKTANQPLSTEEIAMIREIDSAKLTSDNHIQTKYGVGTIRNLSSGCKTYLNIAKNPDKVVSAEECGKNVLEKLFQMDGIHIYMTRPERFEISDDVEICFNDAEVVRGRL